MEKVLYDGSFIGLLTAIFEVYEYKLENPSITRNEIVEGSLFGGTHTVYSDEIKAKRVLKGMEAKMSKTAMTQFYRCFLSELPGMEDCLLRYAKYTIGSKYPVESDYGNPDVLRVQQVSWKVHREKHRMEAFVRFQLTKDNLYYSLIQPDYNVLPLIIKHFHERYADQRWMIYDVRRKYGIYYDLQTVEEVQLDFTKNVPGSDQHNTGYLDETEPLVQQLWRQYFSSVNISERKNMKLHIRHMPKRYWRYLTEKNGHKQ
ncbi:MAG: DNA metabolism protein [Citrobacter freundii]|nr:MAG: DNA metabolism protein [Citrobacter freundii]